jgi:REP element-mobilizing transposase RayT
MGSRGARRFDRSGKSRNEWHDGAHQFEHWYRDRSVYFISSRVRDRRHVFTTPETCAIFWAKFEQYASNNTFEPWIVTLMSNHYHVVGFLNEGSALKEMMRKFHGSVAWMVCKNLEITHKPFWRDDQHRDYFDGCLRDQNQLVRTYGYVERQAVRAGLARRVGEYPNTRAYVSLDETMRRAQERDGYMEAIPYARYDERRKRGKRVDP